MDKAGNKWRRDSRALAAAVVTAILVLEAESASRLTRDAVRTSTAVAARVMAAPGPVQVASGLCIGLASAALCLIAMSRSSPFIACATAAAPSTQRWVDPWAMLGSRKIIRVARSGGARDR